MNTYFALHVVCGLVALGMTCAEPGDGSWGETAATLVGCLILGPLMLGLLLGLALREDT